MRFYEFGVIYFTFVKTYVADNTEFMAGFFKLTSCKSDNNL